MSKECVYRVEVTHRNPALALTLTEYVDFETEAQALEFARQARARYPAAAVQVRTVAAGEPHNRRGPLRQA
jgi:hypothetical protein